MHRLVFPLIGLFCLLASLGCQPDPTNIGRLEKVWGRRGVSEGRFQKPRAIAIDADQLLYTVDMAARIQVFDTEGQFIRCWSTPTHEAGRPTGLSVGIDGNILVADTHYYRVLVYSPEGELLKVHGGTEGQGPGEFGLVTDVVQDSAGNYYVAEMGEYDRIQKFSPQWEYLMEWGSHGSEPGQFVRPQNMAIDENDLIWVADACNHRIQVFDTEGELVRMWGRPGSGLGELYYPYDLALVPGGPVYIVEYGNHRVQKFTREGKSLGCWGREGRGEGQMHNPWALVRDQEGKIHLLDSNNHRIQCVRM